MATEENYQAGNLAHNAHGIEYKTIDASDDFEPSPKRYLETETHALLSAHVIWSGFDAADGTVKLQWSNDRINWKDIPGAVLTLVAAADNDIIIHTFIGTRYARAVYTNNSVTTGTLDILLHAKRK